MTVSAIKIAVYGWLSAQMSPNAVVFADQAAPEPPKPYATIRVGTINKLGAQDESRGTDEDGIETRRGQRTIVVAIQFFGPGAQDFGREAQNSLQKTTVLDSLRVAGLSLIDEGAVLNVAALLETSYEERAALDLTFGFAEEFTDDVGVIESVEVSNYDMAPPVDVIVDIGA